LHRLVVVHQGHEENNERIDEEEDTSHRRHPPTFGHLVVIDGEHRNGSGSNDTCSSHEVTK